MENNKYGENERRLELLKSISFYLEDVGLLEFSFRGAAKAANVSPMTLVRYFDNRDGLLDELLEYSAKTYITHLENTWSANLMENPVETIRKLICDLQNKVYDIESKKLWIQLTLIAESPNATSSMKERYKNIYYISRDYIVQLLKNLGVSIERATDIGNAFHSFSNGVFRDYYTHKNKEIARSSFNLLLNWLQTEIDKSVKRDSF
ncbi:TetR/AcrR family transcriptional regulator [Brassicibacter mesophilus]|uniref:TetR/AcrR family transcriptional regulator n=1 Tax=Brassicibacter mesophilus TaxID=745119 RepID=UPI003D1F86AB